MITSNKLTSATIYKGQNPSGMGRWTFTTLLGKYDNRTTVFTMYILELLLLFLSVYIL